MTAATVITQAVALVVIAGFVVGAVAMLHEAMRQLDAPNHTTTAHQGEIRD